MLVQQLVDTILLLLLGLSGWFIMAKVRFPAAEVLGPVVLIGTLRALQVDLPLSPLFLFPIIQVIIGIFVGSMLNRQTVRELRPMLLPTVVIVSWALSIIFAVGFFLAEFSALDLYTAMLSASMGGLPEITIIALASGASVPVIVVTQILRLLGTVFVFPLILAFLEKREHGKGSSDNNEKKTAPVEVKEADFEKKALRLRLKEVIWRVNNQFSRNKLKHFFQVVRMSWKRVVFTLIVAAAGGIAFEMIGVPAGLLVGSTVFIAVLSLAGVETSKLSPRLFDLLLVFIGIIIADNIFLETISTIGKWHFLIPILIATAAIFATSFAISVLIYRITTWDYPTCFLAAAPGGFTMMTLLAIKHGRDPFKVSMLHLCRLLSINIFLPFLFMYLMSR